MKLFLIIIGILLIGGIGITVFFFQKDINKAYDNYTSERTRSIKTSFGNMEYKTEGEGLPVLVSHGMVGGYDQALESGQGMFGEGYQIIGPSRFGYLNSDLPENPTPLNQAKAFNELTEKLNLDEVVVMATSAGGPSAIRFALEYPEKTKALVMVGSGGPSEEMIEGPTGPPNAIINDFMFWVMTKPLKNIMITQMFGIDKENYKNASTPEKEELDSLFKSMLPIKPRKEGILNDSDVTNTEPIENYSEYDLENLDVPVIIFHARNDPMAKFETAKKMHERLPNSELYAFERGGHLIFGHGEKITEVLNERLKNKAQD